MRTLSERDAAAVASIAAELAALTDALPFPPHVVDRLRVLAGADHMTYNDVDRAHERSLFAVWSESDGSMGSHVPDDDGYEGSMYWRFRHELPGARYRERTSDWTGAYRFTDFVTNREWRRTTLWNLVYRDLEANYWASVGLRSDGRRTRNFVFTKERRDFDERDRLVLELLQPHLQQRAARVEAAAAAAEALASVDWDDPQHVVLCSANGVIEFATAPARRLLIAAVGAERVPDRALREPVAVVCGTRRVTIRPIPGDELTILLLGERDVRLDRLTERQRTILDAAALGRTNREIGERLGISGETVRKHLEQIYAKLEVHTRAEAGALLRRAGSLPPASN